MPTFFIILICVYFTGNVYIFFRAWQAFSFLPAVAGVILSVVFWGSFLCFATVFGLRNSELPSGLSHVLHEIGTGWLVFTLYMVIALLFIDILRLFHIQYIYNFHIALGLIVCILLYGYIHYKHPSTEVINIVINKPATGYQRLKIVGISDIHLGLGITKKDLRKYVDKINQQQPDLIIISGDLIDNSIFPVKKQRMEEELSALHAPLGIYMIPGNHEYITGINESKEFITGQTPIHFLQDEMVTLSNGLQIIGRDDRINHKRKLLADLISDMDPDKPSLLLDHQPYHLEETAKAGIDIQLSGHTHRGQIWPISLITDRLFELSHGYKKIKNTHFYVSSGLSLWGPPFRIGTQSEMVIFNISFEP